MTKDELAKLFMDGMRAKHANDLAKAAKIFTEYLSLVNDPDDISTAYGQRGEVFMEGGQRDAAIADMKKAVDLGADVYEDILKEVYGINYKPQKPSISGGSAPLAQLPPSGYSKGKIIMPDGDTYEGDLLDGKPHGKGTLTSKLSAGTIYEGDWVDGKRHGKGIIKERKNGKVLYKGDFVNGYRSN